MAIVGGTATPLMAHMNTLNFTVDIVIVPAILADPFQAWGGEKEQWVDSLGSEVPGARVLLYDHLYPEERALEIKPRLNPEHQSSVEAYRRTQEQLGDFGIQEWAARLWKCLQKQRNSKELRRRPIVFICHSTGGIVVKAALSMKPNDHEADVAACCLWIAFFSTPHKGSSVLSEGVFARTLQDRLCLKWQMGERLRGQLALSHIELEHLNDRFCSGSTLGIQVSTYVETEETELDILTEADGENLTSVLINVVDPQSAELSTPNAPMEEDIFYMRANHANIAALANDLAIKKALIEDVNAVVRSTNSLERAAHHDLLAQIMNDTNVDVHQFYQADNPSETATIKIWTEKTSLQSFLDCGPLEILSRRIGRHGSERPSIEVQRPSNTSLPIITDGHIRSTPGHLEPASTIPRINMPVPTINEPSPVGPVPTVARMVPHDLLRKSVAFPAPTKERDRFQWIHIPFSVTGWVGPVMKAISKDAGNPDLTSKVLAENLWKSQHNKSRNMSYHSRFVRSLCRVLLPKSDEIKDDYLMPTSAIEAMQMVMYMPYLHWDSFRSLKARNKVINERSNQEHIRPVRNEVVKGKSLEHRVIWQFLGSHMPFHCRRTLDGYGYPSLANIESRDMDQVMFKRTSRVAPELPSSKRSGHHFSSRLWSTRSSRSKPSTTKKINTDAAYVLMVDELWLWVLQDDCMVTFATPKEKEDGMAADASIQADLKTQVLKDVSGDFARKVDDCFDHAALLAFHAVRALLEESEDPALNVFRTFEEHISEIAEMHTIAFKEFRDSHKIDDPKMLMDSSHNLDYSADLNNLLELRDVEDELSTIKKLFVEQRHLIADMLKQYVEEVNSRGHGIHGTALLRETENLLKGYEEQVDTMIRSSKVAQDAFENLLDLKQKHSNIVEAHMTRYQTEMASEQNRSVMIFTVITIIFLPLSFFSSVFGMNVSDWSGTSTNPTLDYVLEVMCLVSLGVILVALALAFNVALRRIGGRVMRRLWRRGARPIWHMLAKAPFKKLRLVASHKSETLDLEKGLTRVRPPSKNARRIDEKGLNGAPPSSDWRPKSRDSMASKRGLEKEWGSVDGDAEEGESR